ncbi:MAG: FAD-dependent oxidoreductase [Acidimicrobiia bacterium]|nr:FAD-dependent oxidoreductase [Acidimicrobiia bacterium]
MGATEGQDLIATGPLQYWDENIPCLAACPVHTNAGAYVAAIADGDFRKAYLTARLPNPFASVCGRVCAAPCEEACRRGNIDEPIAIRALKRFVTEQYGVESGTQGEWGEAAAASIEERPQSVGIVGAGPAGLAAAHDLRLLGYGVTIYEATEQLGGMMVLGIPEYRLDRSVVRAEIGAILDLGVEVRLDTRLGTDVTLDELRSRHDGVFLALGATLGRGLDIEGSEADGVFRAIEFLLNVNQGFQVDIGGQVVVIGGGNVAMDAARTALRADAYRHAAGDSVAVERGDTEVEEDQRSTMVEAIDVARTAIRTGASDVIVVSLESREEMPASEFEIEETEVEGIRFLPRRGPARILVQDGKVVGLETMGVLSVFDEEGRFNPTFDESDRQVVPADTVILAIGQAVDIEALGPNGPVVDSRRTIDIDDETLVTSLADVWAGGDAAKGPRALIDAIADGRRAAASIHTKLDGSPADRQAPGQMVVLDQFHRLDDLYDRIDRVDVPTLETERRIGLAEVETGFDAVQAMCEAKRCLRCFGNILLDVDSCVLCGLCADVCPMDVISLVPSVDVAMSEIGTALLLDEDHCIRCALCVERCPTMALSMGLWTGVGVPA